MCYPYGGRQNPRGKKFIYIYKQKVLKAYKSKLKQNKTA